MSEKVESLVVFMYNIFDFFSDEHYIWKTKQIDLKI